MVSESEPEDDTMLCHAIADAKSLLHAETKEKDAGGVKHSLPTYRVKTDAIFMFRGAFSQLET